ncbi:hypothetical protein IIC65_09420 [Candidatus Sumerlaeota bacterium]|nr:hypothetical protein [Candidatus Sumerlaeota bacterium]
MKSPPPEGAETSAPAMSPERSEPARPGRSAPQVDTAKFEERLSKLKESKIDRRKRRDLSKEEP